LSRPLSRQLPNLRRNRLPNRLPSLKSRPRKRLPNRQSRRLTPIRRPSWKRPGSQRQRQKPAEGEKPLAEVEVRTYEPFTLPDGVTAEEKQLDAFRHIAAAHNLDQAAAQGFLDLHIATIQRLQEEAAADQQRVFADTRKGWVVEVKSDPEVGGAGHQTAMMAVARMRDLFVPEGRRQKFNEMLSVTGVGDNLEFIRMLHTAARYYDEPAAPPMPARPVPDRGGNGAKQPRGAILYDHITSRRAAGRG
jgi:hypothetical protein